MRQYFNVITAYLIMGLLILLVGIFQSWGVALSILNLCLISAVMTMGANIQWGYAGLINFGIMGYTALGGLAAVLVSVPPVREAWQAGGLNMVLSLFLIILLVFSIRYILKKFSVAIMKKLKPLEQRVYTLLYIENKSEEEAAKIEEESHRNVIAAFDAADSAPWPEAVFK